MTAPDEATIAAQLADALIENRDRDYAASVYKFTPEKMGAALARDVVLPLIAQALREAADDVYGDERANGPHAHPLSVATWLRERAGALITRQGADLGDPDRCIFEAGHDENQGHSHGYSRTPHAQRCSHCRRCDCNHAWRHQ